MHAVRRACFGPGPRCSLSCSGDAPVLTCGFIILVRFRGARLARLAAPRLLVSRLSVADGKDILQCLGLADAAEGEIVPEAKREPGEWIEDEAHA